MVNEKETKAFCLHIRFDCEDDCVRSEWTLEQDENDI